MPIKKYCFIPETHKQIQVYNPGTITDIKALETINPNVKFTYCIDEFDKIKLFYVGAKRENASETDEEYIRYKTLQSIKAIFNVPELYDYKLILDDTPRVEFTVWYDTAGNHIPLLKLVEKNKHNTILSHRYTYNFYSQYEKTEG